ncbi:hypothetical protein NKR19_g7246 [Coniochaeta hoffmannii]|uniref:Uncharacterized protein n=1 Tax=Coniochaeta hoffmannii TaxID=91930 RepID=A0AA38RBN4_9PEZI|nr:hypothetical protein NKR19_g7246 [Coniochaeta hoffmannii]
MGLSREHNNPVRTQAKPSRPRPRQQHQGHFDPEELTRRLYIVLADQKANAERTKGRTGEVAKPTEPRPWNIRHHGKEAAERRSKEATREVATSHSSKQTSLKPTGSTSSGELKRQKSSKLSNPRKEPKPSPAKDAPEQAQSTSYHHVPQEAAKQFQRTTTVDTMRDNNTSNILTHKLSKQALRLHLAAGAAAHSSSLRAAVIEEQPVSPIEKLLKDRERVDHWRSNIPDEPAQPAHLLGAGEERAEEFHTAPQYQQHTFHAELARLKPRAPADHQHRRNSTGDILGRSAEDNRLSMVLVERTSLADVLEEGAAAPIDDPDPTNADEHRVDWTQSDEQRAAAAAAADVAAAAETTAASAPAHRHNKPLLSPLLRKADSIWTLRGRLGSGGKEKGDIPQIAEAPMSPKSPKESRSPRGGFFAKFKRQ